MATGTPTFIASRKAAKALHGLQLTGLARLATHGQGFAHLESHQASQSLPIPTAVEKGNGAATQRPQPQAQVESGSSAVKLITGLDIGAVGALRAKARSTSVQPHRMLLSLPMVARVPLAAVEAGRSTMSVISS